MTWSCCFCVLLLCCLCVCVCAFDPVVPSSLYDPAHKSTSSLFVLPTGSSPSTNPTDGVTLVAIPWPTGPGSGSSSFCSKYILDNHQTSTDCCIQTLQDGAGNYYPAPFQAAHPTDNYGYGACKASDVHNCPGDADSTCNTGNNYDSSSTDPNAGSCPEFIPAEISYTGNQIYPRCRPANYDCYSVVDPDQNKKNHCWGTIACYDVPNPGRTTPTIPCPIGGFIDVKSDNNQPAVYHEGDFCFEDGGSNNAKWCGTQICTPPFVKSTDGKECVCPNGEIPAPGSQRCGGGNTIQDPQIGGFQGQSFQFHGLPDEVFNLISSPTLQVNGHFIYLASGKCDYNDTECWTHPGTYIDQLGFSFGSHRVKMVAGSHSVGLHIAIDGERLSFGNYKLRANESEVQVKYHQHGKVHIKTHEFAFIIENSDMFFNMEASLLDHHLLRIGHPRHRITDSSLCKKEQSIDETTFQEIKDKHKHNHGAVETAIEALYGDIQVPLHGLLGQTWRNVVVCGKHWVGIVTDYVASDLFASDYFFNFYHRD